MGAGRGTGVGSRWGRAGAHVAGAVTLVLVAGGLVACTGGDSDERGTLAKDLAQALASGDFSGVALGDVTADDAAAQWTTAFGGLSPWTPDVDVQSVEDVKDDEDSATATLAFTWDVDASDDDWTYTTQAPLVRADGAWHVTWSTYLLAPDLVPGETLGVTRERAPRAQILGAGGVALVEDRPVYRIGIDKTLIPAEQQDAAARGLAAVLKIDPDAYAARVAAAGAKAFIEAITVRQEDPAYDVQALSQMPGVNAVSGTLPLAPTRSFARPILGTVGDATAEIVEASNGAVVEGDLAGLSGLQRQYDAQLRGYPGLTIVAHTADGTATRQLFSVEPRPGTPLVTTIDPTIQTAAESVLADVGPASAVVAIRPSTGEVLAAASGPGSNGLSTATVGTYAPGSTFKVVTALALMRGGLTPDSTVTCPPTVTVDGREFQNFPGYPTNKLGDIPLRTAFANSCNTAFISSRDKASPESIVAAADALGLTQDVDLGFPAFLGTVPADSTGTDHAATMIGQARVQVSPLAMATVAASVAAGQRITPRLVVPAEGSTPEPTAADPTASSAAVATAAAPQQPLTADEATNLRTMMRAVVTEGGATFLQDVPGAEVMAKTGTAQYGESDALQNHVWMIAIQGDLAVAVFVETGDFGSTTAGPIMENFLRAVGG